MYGVNIDQKVLFFDISGKPSSVDIDLFFDISFILYVHILLF